MKLKHLHLFVPIVAVAALFAASAFHVDAKPNAEDAVACSVASMADAPVADVARPTSHAIALESGPVAELAPTLEAAPAVDVLLDTIGELTPAYAGLCGAVCPRSVDDPALPTHYDDAAVTYGIGRQRVVPATYRVEAVDFGVTPGEAPPLLRF